MNILFIGGIYSEHLIPEFRNNCRNGYQFAAQTLQESLIKGLLDNGVSVHVLSFPSVPTFPFGYRKPILKSNDFYFSFLNIGKTIGRINIPMLKYDFGIKKQIDNWFKSTKGKKYILIYSLSAKFLKIAEYIKLTYLDSEICVIVADLPQFMAWNKYYEFLGLKKRDINTIYKNLKYIDKYVLLSKHMADKLPIEGKPWIVMEGIYNPTKVNEELFVRKEKTKIILYTGNIDKRYGIMDVVYAFNKIADKNFSLWICGFGDSENEIREFEEKDNRIKFFGPVSRNKVLQLQKQASLLINPRHSNEEFTKYSFPSKTMEYMASGTPTLMCKLACIPSEYEKHLLFIKDETVEGYKNAMLDVLHRDDLDLVSFGEKARHFVLETKNPLIQTHRIIKLIKKTDINYDNSKVIQKSI